MHGIAKARVQVYFGMRIYSSRNEFVLTSWSRSFFTIYSVTIISIATAWKFGLLLPIGNSSLTSLASFPSTAEHEGMTRAELLLRKQGEPGALFAMEYGFIKIMLITHCAGTDSIRDSVKAEVESFEGRFEDLVNETYQTVKETVDVETLLIGIKLLPISLRPDHLEYLMSNERLLEATNHRQIFTSLNFYWSFLNYGLLAHIVRRFGSEATKQKMQVYELDLQQFRKKTPLKVFAEVCPTVHKATPPEFKTVVSKHEWSGCNMEDVEVFRKKFARNYSLPDCAMMLSELVKAGYQEPGKSIKYMISVIYPNC